MSTEPMLKPVDLKTIRYLARCGEANQYEMSHGKDRVGAESTVWESIVRLKKHDFVEIKHEEPFSKIKGKYKKYFGLTFRGLILALKEGQIELKSIQNREMLVIEWANKVERIAGEMKLNQLVGITDMRKDKRIQLYRKMLVNDMKEASKELETFLRHYDLSNSSNPLIFGEWVWQAFRSHAYNEVLSHE